MISQTLTLALKELGRREGATLFMTLLAAFKALLWRYTGQNDVVIGSPIANRNRAEIEELIGFFVNMLVLRTDVSGATTFRELLHRVREVCLQAYAHQDLPLEQLVEELAPERDMSRTPFFQVTFALQNTPRPTPELVGLMVRPLDLDRMIARFDLEFYLWEISKRLEGSFVYNTDLFEPGTIVRMTGHFQNLLEGIATDPDRRLSDLPLLMEDERHQLLVEWNATGADFPKDACIHQLFEEQVARTPEAIAVVFEDKQLTYRELNCRANRLAHHLQRLGVGPDVFVGICVERSLEMVIGILGILKAGGAYAPLDPSYPAERLGFMLGDAQVPVLLTQKGLVQELDKNGAHIVYLDSDWQAIAQQKAENPSSGAEPDNLAYVLYTSGSTGRPKGVMVPHRALCNHMSWMTRTFPLNTKDHVIQRTPFSFDASVWEFYAPLMAGARLVIAPSDTARDPARMVDTIAQKQVTVLQVVPSLLQMLLEEPGFETCRCLRRTFCGGETLPVELQARFLNCMDAELCNLYGPTEATVDATFRICRGEAERGTVPIGRPVDNTQVFILDRELEPVPVGVPGELCIGGLGLTRGYLHRPALTAERFIPNPFSSEPGARLYRTGDLVRYRHDGNIEFLGRLDHQVKIRGFRIELGEIESVLAQHPAVREAVVTAGEDGIKDRRLVAYVVQGQAQGGLTSGELRRFLKQKLPNYMVPSAFVFLDILPLTPSGKVDRETLPTPDRTRPDPEESFMAPRTPVECLLAEVWQEVLSVDRIGVYDNFFDVGGHSLLSIQVISRMEDRLGVRISPMDMIGQTLGQLATLYEERLDLLRPLGHMSLGQKLRSTMRILLRGGKTPSS